MKKIFLQCSCGGEALHIEKDDGLYYVSIWRRGYGGVGLWYRIKLCWFVMRHGHAYGDDVVLNKEDVEKLKEFVD